MRTLKVFTIFLLFIYHTQTGNPPKTFLGCSVNYLYNADGPASFLAHLWARPSRHGPWAEAWVIQVEGDGERVGESLGSRSASGVRPARAPAVAAGGEVAGLPRVCLPAAGRCLKTRVLGCCGAGRSLVAWVWRVLRWLVCLSALLPPTGASPY